MDKGKKIIPCREEEGENSEVNMLKTGNQERQYQKEKPEGFYNQKTSETTDILAAVTVGSRANKRKNDKT